MKIGGNQMNKKYYSVSEMADYFSISIRLAYSLIEERKIRCIKIKSTIRISYEEMIRFENDMEKEQKKEEIEEKR